MTLSCVVWPVHGWTRFTPNTFQVASTPSRFDYFRGHARSWRLLWNRFCLTMCTFVKKWWYCSYTSDTCSLEYVTRSDVMISVINDAPGVIGSLRSVIHVLWYYKPSEVVGVWMFLQEERGIMRSSQWPCMCVGKLTCYYVSNHARIPLNAVFVADGVSKWRLKSPTM